jgi:hypothetical protein
MYLGNLGILFAFLWQLPGLHVIAWQDPCTKFANKTFIPPADALACIESFPFNETLRQNILTVVDRVFNFYTFEDYYLNSPPPFQESTVNIRAEIARINSTTYAVRLRCHFCVPLLTQLLFSQITPSTGIFSIL